MRIVVPRETAAGERRVALVPESCKKLIAAGYEISIESDAGAAAGFSNGQYADLGVSVVADVTSLVASGDLVLKIAAPTAAETAAMKAGAIYVGSLMPLRNLDAVRALEPFCGEFLYTHVDAEGLMGGTNREAILAVRHATARLVTAAGGITTQEEIDDLDALGVDSVVGMALYTGTLKLREPLTNT